MRRLEASAGAFTIEWLAGARALPGNASGVEMERFGAAVAPAEPGRPEVDFLNRVIGLWPEDAGLVPAICRFYARLGVRPWFEIAPAHGFERLAAALTEARASQIGFHAVLYGAPRGPRSVSSRDVTVREVARSELDWFGDLHLAGHEVPLGERPLLRGWASCERWRFYVADVGGEAAGVAILRIGEGVGLLANASTLPRWRRRGVQAALIERRIGDAAEAGCELVTAQAEFGSGSHRNLDAAGLRVACTKAVWRVR